MFPYIVKHYKKPRRETGKEKGLATDCLLENEIESISKIWKGDISESVKILDKIIPKIPKYKRGGIGGTVYNESSFILPMITPEEIAKEIFQNTGEPTLDELLQALLAEGYHMVFEEIYNMIKNDLEVRKEYEKLYGVLKTEPLQNQLKTLQFIATFLKNAETAMNNGDFKLLFKCNLNLALTFSEKRNILAERFFDLCLSISSNYPCDNDGSSMALSRLHLALYTINNGNYEKAYNDLIYVYEYSRDQKMLPKLEDGESIFHHATLNLVHVCLKLAQTRQASGMIRESEQLYNKAHKFATENTRDSLVIESMRNLGDFFAFKKEYPKALQSLTECLEMCERIMDKKAIAVVCQSIGEVYFMLDDLDKAKGYYQRFVEVSDEGRDKKLLTESYLKTAHAFNNAGHYAVAVEYSKEAFKMIMEDPDLKQYEQNARSLYGVARAHSLYYRYIPLFHTKDPDYIDKLLYWKNYRINSFVGTTHPEGVLERSENIIRKRMKSMNVKRKSEDLVVYTSHVQRLYDLEDEVVSDYTLKTEKIVEQDEMLEEDEKEEKDEGGENEEDEEEVSNEEELSNEEEKGEEENEEEENVVIKEIEKIKIEENQVVIVYKKSIEKENKQETRDKDN